MARANAFWPTAVVGEADSVNSVSASACHIGGPKGVSPGQKALLHGTVLFCLVESVLEPSEATPLTESVFLSCSGNDVQYQTEGFSRAPCNPESHSKVKDGDKRVTGMIVMASKMRT